MIQPTCRPELAKDLSFLTIHCLRAPRDPAAADLARACLSDPTFDWDGFLQYIRRERVSPLIHHAIGSWGILPPSIAKAVHKDHLYQAWVNTRRMDDLLPVLAHLEAEGIPVLLLKGAALLCTLYDKRALRPMADVDLLVPARISSARKGAGRLWLPVWPAASAADRSGQRNRIP